MGDFMQIMLQVTFLESLTFKRSIDMNFLFLQYEAERSLEIDRKS